MVVKLQNKPGIHFEQFTAIITGREYSFSNFAPGQSRKILADSTYPYFYMSGITSEDTMRFQPIDFAGKPLYKNDKIILTLTLFGRNGKRYINKKTRRIGPPG